MASTSTFLMVGLRSSCLIALVLLLAIARFRRAFRFNSVTPMIVSFYVSVQNQTAKVRFFLDF